MKKIVLSVAVIGLSFTAMSFVSNSQSKDWEYREGTYIIDGPIHACTGTPTDCYIIVNNKK